MRKAPKDALRSRLQRAQQSLTRVNRDRRRSVRQLHPYTLQNWKEGRFDGAHKLYLLNGASRPWEFGYKMN